MKNKNNIIIIVLTIIIIGITIGTVYFLNKKDRSESPNTPVERQTDKPADLTVSLNNGYVLNMIQVVNSKEKDNYLISPYSIEIALNMLKEGADKETYNQINNVVKDRDIPTFNSKNRISVANALFIKNSEKKGISNDYINKLQTSYKTDLVIDRFRNPDKINNWVKEKTYGMIPKILNDISPDFVLGLANAVAIDVEWENEFECEYTSSADFITSNETKKVEMMHDKRREDYLKTNDEIGIILPYKSYTSSGKEDYYDGENSTKLEFVAIMPLKKDIRNYINDLTESKFNELLNGFKTPSMNQEIILDIPRFEYSFNNTHFMYDLMDLGIKDVFNPDLSDLSKMKNSSNLDKLYVSDAIHMTYISLKEKGTKAAAVTYFGIDKATAAADEFERINITFNKPFMYMIRDSKTKEILFFGVVENPNEWKGSTCNK